MHVFFSSVNLSLTNVSNCSRPSVSTSSTVFTTATSARSLVSRTRSPLSTVNRFPMSSMTQIKDFTSLAKDSWVLLPLLYALFLVCVWGSFKFCYRASTCWPEIIQRRRAVTLHHSIVLFMSLATDDCKSIIEKVHIGLWKPLLKS